MGAPQSAPRSAIALGTILLLAAALRVVPLGLSNPRFFHVDEWDFVQSAVGMWAEGTLDPGPPYVHPGLYRYSLAAAYPLASLAIPASVERKWAPYVAGRLVSAAMGVLAVWLVYRLGRRLMSPAGALGAALVLAVAPLHVQFSHVAKPDVMSATFVALATLLAWRLAEVPQRRLYAWAGVAVGLAVASKYSGIVAATPVFVAHLAAPGSRTRWRRLRDPHLWLAAACSLAAFAVTSPYSLVKLGTSVAEANRIILSRPPNPEALPQEPALAQVWDQALSSLTPSVMLLAMMGAVVWWRERQWAALAVVGSVIVVTGAMLSSWAVQQPFYLLPLVPAVAVLAAAAIARIGAWRRWAGAALLALCLVPSALRSAQEIVRLWQPGTRQLARAWLEKNLPKPPGYILRDFDSLESTAEESLPVIDAGFGFYDKVDRDYLKRHGITHFVLSDTAAATGHLRPEAAQRRGEARMRLCFWGELLVRIPPSRWREGPGIEIYQVKDSVLRAFEREREQAAAEARAKVKAVEDQLAARPDDAALHLEAGRLLCDLAANSRGEEIAAAWERAGEHFRQAALADPKLGDAPYDLGCLYLRIAAWATGARGPEAAGAWFARAADAFRAAIALDPNQADYHFNLGFALWSAVTPNEAARRHAVEEGTKAYRRAAALNPDIRIPDPHILAVAERGPQPMR